MDKLQIDWKAKERRIPEIEYGKWTIGRSYWAMLLGYLNIS